MCEVLLNWIEPLFTEFFSAFVPAVSSWSAPTPVIVVPPPTSSPVLIPSHKRTPSEADRWLEEVSKSVRVPPPGQPFPTVAPPTGQSFTTGPAVTLLPNQAFSAVAPPTGQSFATGPVPIPAMTLPSVGPVTFTPPQPSTAPLLPPRQPAFHPQVAPQPYPMANGLPFPRPSVPVVGITPSQMVANVFGSASTPPQHDAPVVGSTGPFVKVSAVSTAPPAPNGSATFNGADSWAAAATLGVPQPLPHLPPVPQEDAFEAQWAALEGRSRQRTSPSPTNPFSTELHKTFEIQL